MVPWVYYHARFYARHQPLSITIHSSLFQSHLVGISHPIPIISQLLSFSYFSPVFWFLYNPAILASCSLGLFFSMCFLGSYTFLSLSVFFFSFIAWLSLLSWFNLDSFSCNWMCLPYISMKTFSVLPRSGLVLIFIQMCLYSKHCFICKFCA